MDQHLGKKVEEMEGLALVAVVVDTEEEQEVKAMRQGMSHCLLWNLSWLNTA